MVYIYMYIYMYGLVVADVDFSIILERYTLHHILYITFCTVVFRDQLFQGIRLHASVVKEMCKSIHHGSNLLCKFAKTRHHVLAECPHQTCLIWPDLIWSDLMHAMRLRDLCNVSFKWLNSRIRLHSGNSSLTGDSSWSIYHLLVTFRYFAGDTATCRSADRCWS